MLWAGSKGGLEVRSLADGATCLGGRFPYAVPTVLRDGRQRLREMFERRAFGKSIAENSDVHFLVHHDFDRPLASRLAGSLEVTDTDDALTFEARLSQEMRGVGYVRDFLAALASGLVGGISPGFSVPEGGERVTRDSDGLLRTVMAANLVELSAVTRPAYPTAQVEARNWNPQTSLETSTMFHLSRWRL
ncbi:HK97 family phage prohead protease [Ponticaulis koreensis]|uniref:HK97 family phage prohead protease n=1 Tax=Ponticaulis koreensis TaxID=1123045 RepID=UPI0003B313F9|nr:HK97 family phage prohead protease [Ponticaulis koreensis]